MNWWQQRVVYQIYPRSFKDSNGDGIGDIPGIISELDTLKALGIGIIWLSPVYVSPDLDNGYDIADYYNIDSRYGTMADMDALIEEAEKRDIKIVMDLVINHTSDAHEWFQKSRRRIEPYTDYYIWRDGIDGKLPNNWTSFFAEECWVYDELRKQYYLHLFAKEQPDLNYKNPLVLEEIKKIMTYWLEKGVSGFRCDVINVIYKSSLENGKKRLVLTGSEYYISQEGNHEILKSLRKEVLSQYDCFAVGETVFVTPQMARDLCEPEREELDMVFSFEHMEADEHMVKWFKKKFNPKQFCETLSRWQNELSWNANYFENHDQLRSVSRFGNDTTYWKVSAKMLATLLLSLKGTPFIYQGQEIGMTNFDFTSMDQVQDVESHNVYQLLKRFHVPAFYRWKMIKSASRDNCRTPMQWNDHIYGGFSTSKPWLMPNGNYTSINVEKQKEDQDSILSYYKQMIGYRKASKILLEGSFKPLIISKKIFVFERKKENKSLIVCINFTDKKQKTSYKGKVCIGNYDNEMFTGVLEPYEAVIIAKE